MPCFTSVLLCSVSGTLKDIRVSRFGVKEMGATILIVPQGRVKLRFDSDLSRCSAVCCSCLVSPSTSESCKRSRSKFFQTRDAVTSSKLDVTVDEPDFDAGGVCMASDIRRSM